MPLSLVHDSEAIAEDEEDNFAMLSKDDTEFECSDTGQRGRVISGGFLGMNVINANYMENQFRSTAIFDTTADEDKQEYVSQNSSLIDV